MGLGNDKEIEGKVTPGWQVKVSFFCIGPVSVKDQELELPPYDQADNGDSIYAPIQALAQVPTTGGTRSFTAFLPAGLARMFVSSTDNVSTIEVEVLDKILCKDMA